MMIPEAWENNDEMDPAQRAFYRFHSTRDGAVGRPGQRHVHRRHRDRRRARPQRPAPEPLLGHRRRPGGDGVGGRRDRHRSGEGRHQGPPAAGADVPHRHRRRAASSTTRRSRRRSPPSTPTPSGSSAGLVELDDLPEREHVVFSHDSVLRRQQLFGYTHEELKVILAPMAQRGVEPLGSMGTDTPIAVLSDRPRLLFDYFAQLFAQVTNPPLDAIREEVVTSVSSTVGPEANLLKPGPESCRQLVLPFPIIDNDELAKIIHANDDGAFPGLRAHVVKGLYRVAGGGLALERALAAICGEVSAAIDDGRADHRAVRPQRRRRRGADPVAAAHGGGAPPPDPHEAAHQGRADRRVRRCPRGAPHGAADRLRRRGDQPVSRVRVDRGPDPPRSCTASAGWIRTRR